MIRFSAGIKALLLVAGVAVTAKAQYVPYGTKITDAAAIGYDQFGYGVALNGTGDILAAGTPYAGANAAPYKSNGRVLIYNKQPGGFQLFDQLAEGPLNDTNSYFGKHVAFSKDGNVLIVSGHGNAGMKGAVWVFRRNQSGSYVMEQKLSGPAAGSYFSDAMAITPDGNTIVVGIPRANSSLGAIAVYKYANSTWTQDGANIAPTDNTGNAQFGYAVDISDDGNTIVAGGLNDNSLYGAAWVCKKTGSNWVLSSKIVPTGSNNYAGRMVAIDSAGNRIFISDGKGFWEYEQQNGSFVSAGSKVVTNGNTIAVKKGSADMLFFGGVNTTGGGVNVFIKSGSQWQQSGTTISGTATGNARQAEHAMSINRDGSTVSYGGIGDNGSRGAVWAFSIAANGIDSVRVKTVANVAPVINTNGGTLTVTAGVYPVMANQNVSWSIVPGTGNATITGYGVVTPLANGTVWAKAISMQDATKMDSLQITISNQIIPVDSVIVTVQNNAAPVINTYHGTLQMNGTVFPATANQNVSWSITPGTGTATISNSGIITAQTDGTVWAKAVSVQDVTKTDSLEITLSNQSIPVDSVDVNVQNNAAPLINTNHGTMQMAANIFPATANQNVTWSIVPGTGAATISTSGLVTAQANGTVWAKAISVQDVTKMDSLQITLSNQVVIIDSVVVSVLNNAAPVISTYQGTLQMKAAIYPASANQNVTWSIIPGSGAATISATGLITAQSDGTVYAKAVSVQDANKSSFMQITINQTTGINSIDHNNALTTYPNPTSGTVTLSIAAAHHPALQLALTDMYGKVVMLQDIKADGLNTPYTLNMEHLVNGIYLLRLSGDGISQSIKIIKQ